MNITTIGTFDAASKGRSTPSICVVDGRWLHYPCHGWPNRRPEHQIQVSRTQI